jgi:hypothetical protein
MREGDHFEDQSMDGKVILKWISRKRVGGGGGGCMDWIYVAQDRNR